MKKLLFFLAITEFIIALGIHIVSFAGIDIADKTPPIWMAGASIFVLLIPAFFAGLQNEEIKRLRESGMQSRISLFDSFKILYKDSPGWLKTIAIASQFYGAINLTLLFLLPLGSFDFEDGQHFLVDHGSVLKIMTEEEYHHYRANLVRVLSGFCLAFYAHSAAMLFPFNKKRKKKIRFNFLSQQQHE